MTCSDDPAAVFEFITRPVTYARQPFQLASGELLSYESRFFSMPAYSLLADKRLFTPEASHPLTNDDIKLYINKDAALAPVLEPSLGGDEYLAGTPHYVDYILDLRSLMAEVFALHAADSDWNADDFLQAHLLRNRATYPGDPCCGANLDNSSAADTTLGEFVHPEPATDTPAGLELGAQQMMDIDIDEVQYLPMVRPSAKSFTLIDTQTIPTTPVFPAVISAAKAVPTLNTIDDENYQKLALGVHASGGGLLITGDALVGAGDLAPTKVGDAAVPLAPTIKLLSVSGEVGAAEGASRGAIPWASYPCGKGTLCDYYTPSGAINAISASGRQMIANIPDVPVTNNTVLLLNVSAPGTSGQTVSHYPSNYQSTSGIDANGVAHNGLHVCNKLIYNLGTSPAVGFSPVNGLRVFAHYIGSETSSQGRTWGGSGPKYANGDTLYGQGGITNINTNNGIVSVDWATTNNRFSPINWASVGTTALGAGINFFARQAITQFSTADIQAGSDRGVITRKAYAQWGFIDQLVVEDLDRAQGGQLTFGIINYLTRSYSEGKDAEGNFKWVELEDSPSNHSIKKTFYENTYFINNIWSFFFARKNNNGFVHVNGDVYAQWSPKNQLAGQEDLPRNNLFAPVGVGQRGVTPLTTRSDVIISIGWFPSWARRRFVTTNNQISIPTTVSFTPANSKVISFDPLLQFDDTFVNEFSQPVWDPDAGVNYIYFLWADPTNPVKRLFFAHMDTDFVITRFNRIPEGEGFLFGRPALLSI